jgi:hypothetical protein
MSSCLSVAHPRRSSGSGRFTFTVFLLSSAIDPTQDESDLVGGYADGCAIGGLKRGEAGVLALFVRDPADLVELCLHLIYGLGYADLGTPRENDRGLAFVRHEPEPT